MTIFANRFALLFRSGRNYLYSVFAASLLLVSQSFLNAQPQLTPEIKKVLESIAPYYTAGYDRLTPQLKNIGYETPEELRNWPVIQRLSVVVLTANDQRKAMALLAQNMAQKYGPIKEDPNLKLYLQDTKVEVGEVTWLSHTSVAAPETHVSISGKKVIKNEIKDLSPEVRVFLLSASGYLEGGGLAGTTNILKNTLKLSDDVAFKLQMETNSPLEAISRGIEHASNNEAEMKAFAGEIAFQICKNYQSANHIPEITNAVEWRSGDKASIPKWEGIPIGIPIPEADKGHTIDTMVRRIFRDSTKLGIEIIPDIQSSTIKIVVSPAYYTKVTPPDFYRHYIQTLMAISGKDAGSQIYKVEMEMRQILNALPNQIKKSAYDTLDDGH